MSVLSRVWCVVGVCGVSVLLCVLSRVWGVVGVCWCVVVCVVPCVGYCGVWWGVVGVWCGVGVTAPTLIRIHSIYTHI